MAVYVVVHFPPFSFANVHLVHVRKRHNLLVTKQTMCCANWPLRICFHEAFMVHSKFYSTHSRLVKDYLNYLKSTFPSPPTPHPLESNQLHLFQRLETGPIWISMKG